MRDNGRHLGALADFFGYRADVPVVTLDELAQAYEQVRGACRVRVHRYTRHPISSRLPQKAGDRMAVCHTDECVPRLTQAVCRRPLVVPCRRLS